MKKILLIEDRYERQKEFEENSKLFLSAYSDILDNMIGNKYDELLAQIKDSSFDFQKYDVIISHESAFGNDNTKILTILENTKKPLVYFSGGIYATYYQNIEYEHVGLSSNRFYNQNLKFFLEAYREDNLNLLLLCYGKNWKLYIILEALEKINLFINRNIKGKSLRYKRLSHEVDFALLDSLNFQYYRPEESEKLIEIEDVKKISKSIKDYIYEVVTNG